MREGGPDWPRCLLPPARPQEQAGEAQSAGVVSLWDESCWAGEELPLADSQAPLLSSWGSLQSPGRHRAGSICFSARTEKEMEKGLEWYPKLGGV